VAAVALTLPSGGMAFVPPFAFDDSHSMTRTAAAATFVCPSVPSTFIPSSRWYRSWRLSMIDDDDNLDDFDDLGTDCVFFLWKFCILCEK